MKPPVVVRVVYMAHYPLPLPLLLIMTLAQDVKVAENVQKCLFQSPPKYEPRGDARGVVTVALMSSARARYL